MEPSPAPRRKTPEHKATTRAHRIACTCIYLCLAAPLTGTAEGLNSDELETIYRDLQQPIRLTLANRRTVLGHSINVSNNQLHVGTSEGGGEAIFTFNIDEVTGYEIPGEHYKAQAVDWIERGEPEKAMEVFELLYNQRVNLIPLLPAGESHYFIKYVELILDSPNPARAIAVTTVLKPQITHPAALRALEDAALEGYHSLELGTEARSLAQAWVATRAPSGDSALGYYVLSSDKLDTEDYDGALDLALQPIVFASPTPTDKLAHCYAVAVSAALGVREPEYAKTLYREMQARELFWPQKDRRLLPYYKQLQSLLAETEPVNPPTEP